MSPRAGNLEPFADRRDRGRDHGRGRRRAGAAGARRSPELRARRSGPRASAGRLPPPGRGGGGGGLRVRGDLWPRRDAGFGSRRAFRRPAQIRGRHSGQDRGTAPRRQERGSPGPGSGRAEGSAGARSAGSAGFGREISDEGRKTGEKASEEGSFPADRRLVAGLGHGLVGAPLGALVGIIGPVLDPLVRVSLAFVFVVFILIQREDLRMFTELGQSPWLTRRAASLARSGRPDALRLVGANDPTGARRRPRRSLRSGRATPSTTRRVVPSRPSPARTACGRRPCGRTR